MCIRIWGAFTTTHKPYPTTFQIGLKDAFSDRYFTTISDARHGLTGFIANGNRFYLAILDSTPQMNGGEGISSHPSGLAFPPKDLPAKSTRLSTFWSRLSLGAKGARVEVSIVQFNSVMVLGFMNQSPSIRFETLLGVPHRQLQCFLARRE